MKRQTALLLCALTLSGSVSIAHAIVATYTQPASVVDSGGGVSTSPGYENLGAIGQPISSRPQRVNRKIRSRGVVPCNT